MFLVGRYPLVIDKKNRLAIPNALRAKINADSDGTSYYVSPGPGPGKLWIFPEKYFERLYADLPPAEMMSEALREQIGFDFSQTSLVDPDSQGRILLPGWLLERNGISEKVMLVGAKDRLELQDRSAFERDESQKMDNYLDRRSRAFEELKQIRERQEERLGKQ
ncbi:MAG: hypothetical protein KDA32_07355 [Phycisphaerales bacterium]|nr:hypothetical protein [Phycisphaerales bacterium]